MDLIAPEIVAAAIIVPLALLFALRAPLILPFGIYVALIPYDNVLGNNGATLVRGLAIVSALALVFRIALVRRAVAPPKAWFFWLVLVGWMAMTALWTIDSALTTTTFGQIFQLFLLYSLLAIYPVSPSEFTRLTTVIVVSGVGSAAYGLYLYATGNRFEERLSITSSSGLTIDPNHYAAAMLLPLAIALSIALARGKVWGRLFALCAVLTMTGGLLLSGSRGAFVSLGVVLLYMAWRSRRSMQIIGFGLVALAISAAFPTVWQRFADPTQSMGAGRIFIWNVGFKALADHWMIGAGIGAFPTAYDRVFLSGYQAVFQGWSRPSHNVLIGTAVELGILGVVFVSYAWYSSWRDMRSVPASLDGMPVRAAIEAALVALFVASLFLDTLTFKYLWLALSMSALARNAAMPRLLTRARARTQMATARFIKAKAPPPPRRAVEPAPAFTSSGQT